MTTTVRTARGTADALRRAIGGPVVAPGDAGWDAARQAWNLAVDQRPAAVVRAATPADVDATLRVARARGLSVATQGTGHGASLLGPLDEVILLKTTDMARVSVDAPGRRARAEAGALWGDVSVLASSSGLVPLAGSSPDVGVVGYTLGGGVGWLARRHGLASNSVLAVEVVTADGRLRRVDHGSDPDLFWALRGGGGGFGVVTAIEFALHPVPRLVAGTAVWPAEAGRDLLDTYRTWAASLPDEFTTSFRFLHLPPVPGVPEFLAGRRVVMVNGAFLGGPEEADALLAPLRAVAPAIVDTFAPADPDALRTLHGDPDRPTPGIGDGFLIRALDAEAVDVVTALAGAESGHPLVAFELRQLGGALGRAPEGAGALASLPGDFALVALGVPTDPASAAALHAYLDRITRELAPRAGPRFLNAAGRRYDPARGFDEATYARLRAVKAAYDPHDVVRANHPIPPA